MARLPVPDASAIAALAPDWLILEPGVTIWRIYAEGGRHPGTWSGFRYWGPGDSRFDHHPPPPGPSGRGILYGATQLTTCVAEVFQASRLVDRHTNGPHLAVFSAQAPMHLLNLRGTWPTIAGASMALNSALDRDRTQAWARAIYAAYPSVEGLWYSSAMHANEPCVALFERAIPSMADTPLLRMTLSDAALTPSLLNAAQAVGYALKP